LTPDGSFVLGASISSVILKQGLSNIYALPSCFLLSFVIGMLTAFFHLKIGISKLLSGILSMLICYSLSLRIMNTSNLSLNNVSSTISNVSYLTGLIPIMTYLTILSGIFIFYMLILHTKCGLYMRAVGDSETAVNYHGIDRRIYLYLGLGLTNGMAGISGAIISQYQGFVDASMGAGLVIICLAAIVIGESLLKPQKYISLLFSSIIGMFVYQLLVGFALRLGLTPADLKISTAILAVLFIPLEKIRQKKEQQSRQIGNRNI
jgi:putative ABC transport system permease protein